MTAMEVFMKYGLNLREAKELFESGHPIRITLKDYMSATFDRHDFGEIEYGLFESIIHNFLKYTTSNEDDLIFEVV